MRILTDVLFTLAWWLRKPMLWLVRARVAPDDLKARLNLDPERPVCFVLPQRSWADLFVLDRICKEQNLPRPHRTGNDLPSLHRPGYLYLSVLLEARLEGGRGRQDLFTYISRTRRRIHFAQGRPSRTHTPRLSPGRGTVSGLQSRGGRVLIVHKRRVTTPCAGPPETCSGLRVAPLNAPYVVAQHSLRVTKRRASRLVWRVWGRQRVCEMIVYRP